MSRSVSWSRPQQTPSVSTQYSTALSLQLGVAASFEETNNTSLNLIDSLLPPDPFLPHSSMNPWLTYGESLHRLREFGVTAKEMDLIDEAKLSGEQMRKLCAAM